MVPPTHLHSGEKLAAWQPVPAARRSVNKRSTVFRRIVTDRPRSSSSQEEFESTRRERERERCSHSSLLIVPQTAKPKDSVRFRSTLL